ncbi:hypothetical protein LEP1GSC050_3344 [Leptospira broomii serovar Hurstbridge str. 5399]|uniref:Uncharacterized protein n=1 Tax=Leptospira broomii serovar Hurstbridge str. 5399 TaxID=1049789 RepID=T0GER5_9LEPT|nr:hypothetical protein LEP1GSC050_3344 [Leptospira broomii serovar Hurstbridge str. 5399]
MDSWSIGAISFSKKISDGSPDALMFRLGSTDAQAVIVVSATIAENRFII